MHKQYILGGCSGVRMWLISLYQNENRFWNKISFQKKKKYCEDVAAIWRTKSKFHKGMVSLKKFSNNRKIFAGQKLAEIPAL